MSMVEDRRADRSRDKLDWCCRREAGEERTGKPAPDPRARRNRQEVLLDIIMKDKENSGITINDRRRLLLTSQDI